MNLLFLSIRVNFVAQKGVNHVVIECTLDNTFCNIMQKKLLHGNLNLHESLKLLEIYTYNEVQSYF